MAYPLAVYHFMTCRVLSSLLTNRTTFIRKSFKIPNNQGSTQTVRNRMHWNSNCCSKGVLQQTAVCQENALHV